MTNNTSNKSAANPMPMQGEGDYAAARKFDKEEAAFARSGKVETKAAEAKAALDGPEGGELEAARTAAAQGESIRKRR
jgi:hypothetical protein